MIRVALVCFVLSALVPPMEGSPVTDVKLKELLQMGRWGSIEEVCNYFCDDEPEDKDEGDGHHGGDEDDDDLEDWFRSLKKEVPNKGDGSPRIFCSLCPGHKTSSSTSSTSSTSSSSSTSSTTTTTTTTTKKPNGGEE